LKNAYLLQFCSKPNPKSFLKNLQFIILHVFLKICTPYNHLVHHDTLKNISFLCLRNPSFLGKIHSKDLSHWLNQQLFLSFF
jgi:hypothetical protein